MAIQLDHIIVPAHDRVEAARRLAGLLDVAWDKTQGEFSPVYVNEGLTLDFARRPDFEGRHHICFRGPAPTRLWIWTSPPTCCTNP